ncbi:MAG: tetratricopeptide repeat protein [Sedimentisphaerales bacterium]|nr:tetratricopeptide repeat protein [Sedimentisphaerales bacterium]
MLERTLPVMLSVRLGLEPQIIMLEREDLKVLLDEKLRTEGEDTKFWNSAILIDGYLQPSNSQLEIHLNLKQAAGDNLKSIIIPVEPNEPAIAITKATTEITQQLQNSPPAAKWNPEQEAEQFYNQGQLLSAHSRYEEALPLFETAHALQPQNVYYTGALFTNEWTLRNNNIVISFGLGFRSGNGVNSYVENRKPHYSDYELAEIVSILVRQIRDSFNKGEISTRVIFNQYLNSLGYSLAFSQSYFSSDISVANEQIRQMNRDNRKIWVETFDSALQKQLVRTDQPRMNNLIRARLVWISSDEPRELLANVRRAFQEYVMPSELGGKIASTEQREYLLQQAFLSQINLVSYHIERTHLKDNSDEFRELLRQYIFELGNIEDEMISSSFKSFIKRENKNNIYLFNKEDIAQARSNRIEDAQKLLDKLLNSNEVLDSRSKKQIVLDIGSLLASRQRNDNVNEICMIWENLCNFLIKQKDIPNLIEVGTHYPFPVTDLTPSEYSPWLYKLLGRISEVLQSQQVTQQVNTAITQIRDAQLKILKSFPELDRNYTRQNIPVTMLLTMKDWARNIPFSDRAIKYVFHNNILWVAYKTEGNSIKRNSDGNKNWPNTVGFAGIDIQKSRIVAIWQTDINCNGISELSGIAINKKTSYISVENGGIIQFPGSSIEGREYFNNPKIFTQPSFSVTSIALDSNNLWVAYGGNEKESGLGLYNTETEKWETVFCSTLKEQSPFNNAKPYEIMSMIHTDPDKLYISVFGNELSGLWKIDTKTKEYEFIKSVTGELTQDTEGEIWLKSTSYWLKMDPDAINMTLIIRAALKQFSMSQYGREFLTWFDMEKTFLSESFLNNVVLGPYYAQTNFDPSTGAIHDNKLWARLGERQILIIEKGKSFEEAQIIDNNILDGELVHRFVSTPYGLIGIGEGVVGLIETEDMGK